MRILLCFFISFFSFGSFSSVVRNYGRVENGTPISAQSNINRSIAYMYSSTGLCTATFLTTRFLLTAAHCTYKNSAAAVEIRVRDEKGTWYAANVARLITHPEFRMEKTSIGTKVFKDVALIELAEVFPFKIYPMRIGNVSEFTNAKQVSIWGYGKSAEWNNAGTLRRGTMMAKVEAQELFYGRTGLSMVMDKNNALCGGDSGGPVLNAVDGFYYLVGVNSLSNGCTNTNSADVTSKAEIAINHRPWIRSYVTGI